VLRAQDWWRRPPPTTDQVRRDALLGALLVLMSLLVVELMRAAPTVGTPIDERIGESYLWAVVVVAPLMLRRRFPVTVMVIISVAFYGAGERVPQVTLSAVVQVALFCSIYTAWAWARHRHVLIGWSAVVVLGMFAWLVELIVTTDPRLPENASGVFPPEVAIAVMTLGINLVYFVGAMAWGLAARRSARQHVQLEEQTEALRLERDRSARRAVAEERMRIARDLHDVVAHHVTGIGVQAAAARHVLEKDPESSRSALSSIEASSRSAVLEMHQLVGLLRDEGAEESAQPSLAAVPALATGFPVGRLRVTYREVGDPFPVPAAVGTSAYRTVQEALTNVGRHSTARAAEVVLRYLDNAIEVEVLDDGPAVPAGTASSRPGRGFGLQGIRERVGVHGGQCEIGPRPDGGFRVRVRLPVEQLESADVVTTVSTR
jgi:signal transduction histidine kinase